MQAQALTGGFANAPIEAATAFRAIMQVMAQPGKIETLAGAAPPAPLSIAAGTVILTLCDADTPVFLAPSRATPQIRDWITFHTSAPFAAAADARFALGTWAELAPSDFAIGTSEYPDRSATLIVEVGHLERSGATLRGPGIKDTAHLSLPDLKPFQDNTALFPLGHDYFFTTGTRIAALPRSTKVS